MYVCIYIYIIYICIYIYIHTYVLIDRSPNSGSYYVISIKGNVSEAIDEVKMCDSMPLLVGFGCARSSLWETQGSTGMIWHVFFDYVICLMTG